MSKQDILLVYDKECPVCHYYCQKLQGELKIVNARLDSDVMHEITEQGLDIDQGMVLKVGNTIYYGADAIHGLALMSTRVGIFSRLNYWLFKSKAISRVIYPILRFFRNLLLKLLGRSRINNLGVDGNTKF